MSSVLALPRPGGDASTIGLVAADLRRRAETIDHHGAELLRLDATLTDVWRGEAAEAFGLQISTLDRTVRRSASTHRHAAALLDDYGSELESAQRSAARARRDVESAVDTFRAEGRSRASHLASSIRSALETVDGPLGDLPGVDAVQDRLVDAATGFLEKLTSWDPKPPVPTDRLVASADDVRDVVSDVASTVESAAEWGVDQVLDGIGVVLDLVGGLVDGAVSALRAVQDALVDAVRSAVRLVEQALAALFDLGRHVATVLTNLALEIAEGTFDALISSLAWVAAVGPELLRALGTPLDIAVALLQLPGIAWNSIFSRDGRRIEDAEAADYAAFLAFQTDPAAFDRMQDDYTLSGSEYAYSDTGAPPGWTRLPESTHGAGGFYGAVFENDRTGEIVIAFRGSEPDPFDSGDWRDDAMNANNLPTVQAAQAIAMARDVQRHHPGADLRFAGHSLGGSLASVASIATGRPATTFNAAGIGDANHALALAAGGRGADEHQIVNYHTNLDPLTLGQQVAGIRPAAGAQVTIASTSGDVRSAHDLDDFDFDASRGRR